MKSIFNIVLLLLASLAMGQAGFPGSGALNQAAQQGGGTTNTYKPPPPKVKVPMDWKPNYLKLSYDIVPPIRSVAISGQKSQEFQALLSVDKFFLALEAGGANFTRNDSRIVRDSKNSRDSINWSYNYTNKGTFFRLGPEVNMIKNNKQGGALTLGLRYAQSTFSDRMRYTDELGFGRKDYTDNNSKITSRWVELTSGLNVVIWEHLNVGFTVRYKIQRGDKGIGTLIPFDIPGFGLYRNFNTVGFNYYFGWSIPLRKLEEAPLSN